MQSERVTLTLGAEKVELPRGDVEQLRALLVEQPFATRELKEALAEALSTGCGRIVDDVHRLDLVSALEAMHSPELRRLWEVARKPILFKDRL